MDPCPGGLRPISIVRRQMRLAFSEEPLPHQ